MKINITKDKARFIVNEDARKVICIIDNTSHLFIDYVDKNLMIRPDCDNTSGIWNSCTRSRLYPKLHMPRRFVGIATCDPNDEFSVEAGKLIAFSKAKDKIQNSFFKRADLYVNTIDNWLQDAVDAINNYGKKLTENTKRRHQKITELIGEPEEK